MLRPAVAGTAAPQPPPRATMNKLRLPRLARTIVLGLLGLAAAVAALWWAVFALKPYTIPAAELDARYAHRAAGAPALPLQFGDAEPVMVGGTAAWAQTLRFTSFDGDVVLGRIVQPTDPRLPASEPGGRPVLLALHAMGRTQWRWWQAEFKGRPTIEKTHLLAAQALQAGYAVVALDARAHGDRKDPERPFIARELLRRLHWWGEREPYERLIVDTVKDYRVLLDGLARQPHLDTTRVRAAGYSMGAQMALLLAAMDPRVRSVAAMVPPHLDAKVAAVAPVLAAPRMAGVEVWLLTADDDDHASPAENAALFERLPGPAKRHLRFPSGHLLPPDWVEPLQGWLEARADGPGVMHGTSPARRCRPPSL